MTRLSRNRAASRESLDFVRARQAFVAQLRTEVHRRLGPEPLDVRRARSQWEEQTRRSFRISSKPELVLQVEMSDLVYGGDFHAFSQSQRTHLRILRSLQGDRPVVLALEALPIRSQKWIDDFNRGTLNAEALRRKVRWAQTWGFPWAYYLPLIELARAKGFILQGLGLHGSAVASTVKQQDLLAAQRIAEIYRTRPQALIYTIFGIFT